MKTDTNLASDTLANNTNWSNLSRLCLLFALVACICLVGCSSHDPVATNLASSTYTSSGDSKDAIRVKDNKSQTNEVNLGYANPAPQPPGYVSRHTDPYSPVQARLYDALRSGDLTRIRDQAEATRAWIRENRPKLQDNLLLICGVLLNDSKFEMERRARRAGMPPESFSDSNLGSAAWFSENPRQYLSSLLRVAEGSSIRIFASLEGTFTDQEVRELALLVVVYDGGPLHTGAFVELYPRFRSERFRELSQYLYARAHYAYENYAQAIEVAEPLQQSSNKYMRNSSCNIVRETDAQLYLQRFSLDLSLGSVGIQTQSDDK